MQVIVAPRARRDIASILAWTEEHFGLRTLKLYGELIATAIEQVAANPELAGSNKRPEIAENCRTYHLYFSRKSAGRAGYRIRQPRHLLLYRFTDPNFVEIGRVLHDSMELQENLPPEYRSSRE
jgi:toxin ParE1/3/4